VASVVHHHERRRATVSESDGGATTWRTRILGRVLFTPIAPGFRSVLRRAVREFQPDVLHFHVPNPSALWAITDAESRGRPWVVQWQSDVVSSRIERGLVPAYFVYAPLEQLFLRRAAAILVATPPYLNSSKPLAPWRDKCHVIPLGISPDRLPFPSDESRLHAEQVWQPGFLRVLVIGRLTYYKGHEIAINAIARNPNAQLCIVGNGDRFTRLQQLIDQLQLSSRVRLMGSLPGDQVRALLATCDCLCLPSLERTEAFGLVLAEAMRYGKLQVASDIPGSGVGWVVERDRTGLLVPPGNVEQLAAALERLQADPALREKLGRSSADSFQRFDIGAVASQIEALYRQVLAGNSLTQ
jgi:rhamnosyl/mannosyltransferase